MVVRGVFTFVGGRFGVALGFVFNFKILVYGRFKVLWLEELKVFIDQHLKVEEVL